MKKLMSLAAYFAVFFIVSFFSCNSQIPKANLKTAVDSVSYAQGVFYGSQQVDQIFARLGLDESYKADFIKGFQETFNIDSKDKKANAYTMGKVLGYEMGTQFVQYFNGQLFGEDETRTMSKSNFLAGYITSIKDDAALLISRDEAQMYSMMAMENIRQESMAKQNEARAAQFEDIKNENLGWLENNKSNEGVIALPSGLQYKVLKEGKGAKPTVTDVVRVSYIGSTIDGNVFQSNESIEFPLSGVIGGWTEGLQLMPVGSTYIFYIPYDLAYGEHGSGSDIPPYATLIFEVELFEIIK